jgi:hypothetical protein
MTEALIPENPQNKALDERIDEVIESIDGNGRF